MTACPVTGRGWLLVDHRFALVPLTRPSAPDKKSFSMVSSPILAWSSGDARPLLRGLLVFSEDEGGAF